MIIQLPCGNFVDTFAFTHTSIDKQHGNPHLILHVGPSKPQPFIACKDLDEARRLARDIVDYMQAASIEDSDSANTDDLIPRADIALRIRITATTSGLVVEPVEPPSIAQIEERIDEDRARKQRKQLKNEQRAGFLSPSPLAAASFDQSLIPLNERLENLAQPDATPEEAEDQDADE